MNLKLILISILFFGQQAFAGVIIESKDWVAEKDIQTPLGKVGCSAQTVQKAEGTEENWVLQVVKLKTDSGNYSAPMILSFPVDEPAHAYYEAMGQSNKGKLFDLTLLQANGDKSIVANRLNDRLAIIRDLKAHSTFSMQYIEKDQATRTAVFSLSGSSKAINGMLETCR